MLKEKFFRLARTCFDFSRRRPLLGFLIYLAALAAGTWAAYLLMGKPHSFMKLPCLLNGCGG